VAAGVTEPERARELAGTDPGRLELLRRAASLGGALRSLEVASGRIAELVDSLRAQARPDTDPVEGVDVNVTVTDALRLLEHRLEGVEVRLDLGRLPTVRAHPGALGQVWTNLLANAAEALEGAGHLDVVTDAPDPARVRVRVVDDGPGVPADLQPRLFEPRFTTKRGTVRFGLGLGLALAKRVVDVHGGTIGLSSRPGRTEIEVFLPVAGPPGDEHLEGEAP
jgi:two-component system, NtrC family, sensor kinase